VPQIYWAPETTAPLEVRLKVSDRAGNVGEDVTVVSVSGQVAGGSSGSNLPNSTGSRPSYQAPIEVDRKLINKKRISLRYKVDQVGKSGLSAIDVWVTQDGTGWRKYDPVSVDKDTRESAIPLEFPGEGLYGITLVAKSGVGLSEPPPRPGDAPQIWVEVDLTPPVVDQLNVLVGRGDDKGKVNIYWKAGDKNLAGRPITISYAEKTEGPWVPITTQPQLNSGRYAWSVPQDVPSQFYVRVQAVDRAGNIGEAITTELVKVDLAVPKAKILQIDGN
jgi:hypothetical protein